MHAIGPARRRAGDDGARQLARLRLPTMGFIFQHVQLLKNLCLIDNVVLPPTLPDGHHARSSTRARWR
jgi:predicted ABC-type transport system involved in lysophospholipase L1 biosynthesis ATPase subunit